MKYLAKWMLIALIIFSCGQLYAQEEKETLVVIDTDMGKIKVRLFNDTPNHRDNFIKNINENLYDGLLFHRVIKQFMIQAGDINSKTAAAGEKLGEGDPDYTLAPEIVYPKYFHKRGMLCAARKPDESNPSKESSASQFYIVTGKYFTEHELEKMEKEKNITLTPEQKEAYMLQGGAPHLDNAYTIFGEVIKGMKVVEKIEFVTTDLNDRPTKDIKIKSVSVVDK
ncbi:MAG: peptidylprolyl isomerase [Tannerellaceae bacterium]|nr:peptidylprolyl isomerase [Tannerellaceae bacterium]